MGSGASAAHTIPGFTGYSGFNYGELSDNAARILYPKHNQESKIEISITCKDLISKEKHINPFTVVYDKDREVWREIGRTEIMLENKNPSFTRHFPYIYCFNKVQFLKFDVYTVDSKNQEDQEYTNLTKQKFLGTAEIVLPSLIASHTKSQSTALINNNKSCGSITIEVEEMADQNADCHFEFILHTEKEGHLYFQINRKHNDGNDDACYRSEINEVVNNLIAFNPVDISIQALCNADKMRGLIFRLFEWKDKGETEEIGWVETNVLSLQSQPALFFLSDTSEQVGKLDISVCEIVEKPTFLQYMKCGYEMNFMVGINFNSGKPRDPSSLHYLNPNGQPNQYEFAIRAAGKVLEYYDSDQEFPVYGFGGCICGLGSHLFPLTLINNPVVKGVNGILEAYKKAIPELEIVGDTVFQPIVYTAAQLANEYKQMNNGKYLVLMIITDGTIIDIEETIHEIVNASVLPLSIILVGIGSADFGNMVRLDGDEEKLKSNGIECKRDIVQFVSMREYLNKDPFQLTKSLLEELPNQFISYMSMNNILPTAVINKGSVNPMKFSNNQNVDENNTLMKEICGNVEEESKNENESILRPNFVNTNNNSINNITPNMNAILSPSNSAPSIQQISSPQHPSQQPQSSPFIQQQQQQQQQQQLLQTPPPQYYQQNQPYYPQPPPQPQYQQQQQQQQPYYPIQPPQQPQMMFQPPNQYIPQPRYYPQQSPPQTPQFYMQQPPRTPQMMQQIPRTAQMVLQPRTPYYSPQQNMPRYSQPLQQPYQPPNTPRPITMNFPPLQILSKGGFVPPW